MACFWVRIGQIKLPTEDLEGNWIIEFEVTRNFAIYVHAVELIIATFTTIGYGSLYAINSFEKSMMLLLIPFSLILFSLIQSQLSSYELHKTPNDA